MMPGRASAGRPTGLNRGFAAAYALAMSVPFVGRDEELRALGTLISGARRAGAPTAALVTGEPGSGKSRLLREALVEADPRRTVLVAGFEPIEPIPLAALGDLIRRLATVPDHGPRLEAFVFGSELQHGQASLPVFEAAHRALSAFGPLVLAIDDLQWVDGQSLALLHYLIRAAESVRHPLTVIVASRPSANAVTFSKGIEGPLPEARRVTIELRGLPKDSGVALARAIDARLDEPAAYELWRRAAGSPFWLEALARGRGAANARDLVADRLRTLSADGTRLASALAIVARPATRDELAAIVGWSAPQLDDAVGELVGRGLASELPGAVRLAHDLIREAAAETVPAATARRLHARLADLLEASAEDDLAQLTESLDHRTAAGLSAGELAIRIVTSPQRRLLGGDQLRGLSAIADELAIGSTDQLSLDRALGQLAAELGEQEIAFGRWRRLATAAGDAGVRQQAEIEAARAAYLAGYAEDWRPHLARARALPLDPLTAIRLDALEATILLDLENDPAGGSAVAERAAAEGRRLLEARGGRASLDAEARAALAEAFGAAANAAWVEDRGDDVIALTELALATGEGLGDEARLPILEVAGAAFRQLGLFARAEELARAWWETSQKLMLPSQQVEAGMLLARVLYGLGRLAEAQQIARETDKVQARIHPWPFGEMSKAIQATIELSLGVPGAVERFAGVAPGLDRHRRISLHQAIAVSIARRDGPRGAPKVDREMAAAQAASDAVGCPRCSGELRVVSVEVLARLGRLDEARREFGAWESGVRGQRHVARDLWRLRADASIAMAARSADAADLLEKLAAAYEAAGWQLDAAWARRDLGRVQEQAGDRSAAIATYKATATLARRTGALPVDRLAAQALRRLGVRSWRRGPSVALGGGLTSLSDREREIAQLVASGASNREIAESLVVSPKTVERHVTNILAKVGARNRTELARHVHAQAEHVTVRE